MLVRHCTGRLAAVVVVGLLGLDAAAQDRVILFKGHTYEYPPGLLPGEIQEVEVTQGGRGWSVRRTVSIPHHSASTPVATADGRRIVWLVLESGSSRLAQYDVTTGRASLIDAGVFHQYAFVVADPHVLRVFVVESQRVIGIDAQFRRHEILLPSLKNIHRVELAAGRLFVQRRSEHVPEDDNELLVVNPESGAIERTVAVGAPIAMRRDGQRYYRLPRILTAGTDRIELVSLATGPFWRGAPTPAGPTAGPRGSSRSTRHDVRCCSRSQSAASNGSPRSTRTPWTCSGSSRPANTSTARS